LIIMRATTITLSLIGLLFTGVFSLSLAQPTQPVPWHPCAQIRAACTQAGFIPNGAKMGVGILCRRSTRRSCGRAKSEIRILEWTACNPYSRLERHDEAFAGSKMGT